MTKLYEQLRREQEQLDDIMDQCMSGPYVRQCCECNALVDNDKDKPRYLTAAQHGMLYLYYAEERVEPTHTYCNLCYRIAKDTVKRQLPLSDDLGSLVENEN